MSIRPLLLAACVAAPPPAAPEPPAELDPVVVTATRFEQPVNRLPAPLLVITRAEIERSGATHLAEVLRARAGVEVIDAFGDGSRTLVGLRGFGENAHSNTLVLVNGRRLNNPDIASPDLNSIPLAGVERIEIVQGSAGALYGDQAVGGVINIITRDSAPGAALALAGGSYARRDLRLHAGTHSGRGFGFSVRGALREADNYRDHNALSHRNATLAAGYAAGRGDVRLEFQSAREDLLTPGALLASEQAQDRRQSAPEFRNDFSDTGTGVLRLSGNLDLGDHWTLAADAARREVDGRFRLSFRGFMATQDATQARRIHSFNPRASARFALGGREALLTLGVDAQDADYRLVSQFGVQENRQRALDGYAQLVAPLTGRLEATLGLRHARVGNDLRDSTLAPGGRALDQAGTVGALGFALRPGAGIRVFARYDQNVRFPKVDEYFGSGFAPADLGLRPQTGASAELGAEWSTPGLHATIQAYRLDLEDEIVFDPGSFTNENLEATRRDGQMLELAAAPSEGVQLRLSYTHVEASVRRGPLAGRDVPLVAEHVGRLAAVWEPLAGWHGMLEVHANSERVLGGDFDNSLRPLPGYATANAALAWRPGRWRLELRANNLLDKAYAEFGAEAAPPPAFIPEASFYPSPGRNAWIGLGYDW